VDADSLAMPGVNPDVWYDPLVVRPAERLCPAEPAECGNRERLAVDVIFEDTLTRVFDGNDSFVGVLGMYQVIVAEAAVYRDLGCEDFPASWFAAFFASLPVR